MSAKLKRAKKDRWAEYESGVEMNGGSEWSATFTLDQPLADGDTSVSEVTVMGDKETPIGIIASGADRHTDIRDCPKILEQLPEQFLESEWIFGELWFRRTDIAKAIEQMLAEDDG